MVMTMASLVDPHGPAGSALVRVSVTVPAVISAALGVYTAFRVVLLGLNVPVPRLQIPVDAPPVIDPARVTLAEDAHTTWSTFALVTTGVLVVIVVKVESGTLQSGADG